jgi:hypothetical protein
MPRSFRPVVPVLAAMASLLGPPAVASADTTSSAAARKALSALGVRKGDGPVVVFRQPRLVPARTTIGQAGASTAGRAERVRARVPKLRRAGVTVTTTPAVTRTRGEAAWLFYEDQVPYQSYEHRGRVVLVGARTGRVTVTRPLDWPPLIDGRLPVFLKGYEQYRDARYRVFARSWRLRGSAPAATSRTTDGFTGLLAAPLRDLSGVLRAVSDAEPAAPAASRAVDPAAVAASKAAADALAAERSCAIRVSDTLGDFYDVGPVDRSRAELGTLFERLAGQNRGFHTSRYRYLSGTTPAGYVAGTVRRDGCKDVFLYLGGGGYRAGEPAINVGTRGRADGRVEQQVVTARDVRAILRAHRGVTFKVMIDAPNSGAFLPVLRQEDNLVYFTASSGAGEGAFTALSDVTDAQGRPVPNRYNASGHLEYTNRQLKGLKCFLSRPDEVAAAARARAEGRSRSFLGWMLARSFSLCAEGNLTDLLKDAPRPVIDVDGGLPPAPDARKPEDPAKPPAPGNRAPVAARDALTTAEDTAVSVTLAGTDPDGDPLTPAVVDGPVKGALTGEGATRIYTPARDATGRDSFTFSVSDGRARSATATVTIDVTPVDDAPTVGLGTTPTTFAEGAPAVAVDPGATVTDVDDDRIEGATLRLGGGFAPGDDELRFTDTPEIAGAYDAATGVLELAGSATVAQYQAAIRSVRFSTAGANPSAAEREVAIRATDGELQGEPAVRRVAMRTVNDAPVLAGGGTTASLTEDDATGVVVAPSVTASDVDSPTFASATVRIIGGLAPAEDRLLLAPADGIAGTYDEATGVLTLSGTATVARYEAALRRVRYRNANTSDPSVATRTFSVTVDDGGAADARSNAVTTTATLTAVDDAPTVAPGGSPATFVEGGPAVAVDPALGVGDPDDPTLTGATVRITGGGAAQDTLALPATAGLTTSWDAATRTLSVSGTATTAAYEAALRSVTFATGGDDPSAARRTVGFSVTDGDRTSATADAAVDVRPVNDAPVLAGGGNTVTFVEDDATGVTLDPNVTVSDRDSTTLASATITIASNLVAAEDRLEYTPADGIAGSYDPATGILTLTGTATPAAYEAALRRVRYRNTNTANPSDAQRQVQFRVNDGASSSNVSTAVVSTVDVDGRNDAPTVTAGGGSPTFTEGGTPVTVDPALAVADADDATLAGATVSVGSGFVPAEDRLDAVAASGITVGFDAATGILSLSGTATVAQYQAVLRTVTYRNLTVGTPSTTPRAITFAVTDGTATSARATTTVAVEGFNDAPVLVTSVGITAFAEDAGPVAVDPAITLTDADAATIAGATVQLQAGLLAPQGRLSFTATGSITGTYDGTTGVLTLSGADTVLAYETALRSVTFEDPSDTPDTGPRTVAFRVTDGGGATSGEPTKTVSVTAADDRPVVAPGGATPVYTESDPAVPVDPDVTVSDPDTALMASATVCICQGLAAGEDELAYVAGDGISGAYDAATGRLTLSGSASPAAYQAALRRVSYRNTSTQPSPGTRRIDMRVTDGTVTSTAASTTLAIDPVNTAPTLAGGGNTVAYTEGDAATPVNGALTVSDPDDTQLDGAAVAITGGFAPAEDRLVFTSTAGITGSFDVITGVLTLTGKDTLANYQTALRAVRYDNLNTTAPTGATRTVGFTVNDGDDDSTTQDTTITVASQPDAPVVTPGTGNVRTFAEGGAPVAVDDAVTVADVDSPQLSGATVSITAGFSSAQGDALGFVAQSGISGSYVAGTGVLTLTGTATVAQYQAALRSVTFSNTSDAPSASRTITTVVRDTTPVASAAVTHGVTLQGVNDAPALAGGGALAYTENDPATAVSPALTVTDVDSANLTGARVVVTGGHAPAEDVLSVTNTATITGSYDAATGALTLSGTDTVAAYQAALRTVRYRNTSEAPSEAGRTLTYTVTDSGSPGSTATTTATVAVTAVNDAPTAGDDANTTVGNTRLAHRVTVPTGEAGRTSTGPSVLANDTDVDGPGPITLDVTASPATSARGGAVTWNADGEYTYVPPTGFTGTDTLTYRATDGTTSGPGTVEVEVAGRVWYVRNTASGGGTGRSSDPFDTLAEADAAANAAADRIFVLHGDGTTAGLTGGVALLDDQRLIGAAQDLQVGADQLYDGTDAQRPSVAGTVAVEDGNTVAGLAIDGGPGAAISGAADAGGTLADLRLRASAGGTGLSLANTTGTWNVSDTTVVAASTGEGVVLSSAGTVNFAAAGTVTVTTAGGRGIAIAGTTTSGTIDSTTVGGSPTTGIALTSTTGSLTFDDVDLTTTGTGLLLDGADGVTVTASGDGDVTSAGTAVDVSSDAAVPSVQPKVTLDQVTSTGGSTGVRVADIGAGTFVAGGGTLSGHTAAELSVTGGSGTISYGGTIGDGSGLSARVDGRTGGAVTVSGSIDDTPDAGGGIRSTGGTGGTVTFSGATKTLGTGSADAVVVDASGTHALRFTGGGLDIYTSGGTGLRATGTGLIGVTGAENTISAVTASALLVDGPDIAPGDLTFRSVGSTSAATAGVRLTDTGTQGGLNVTGSPVGSPDPGSGGTISYATGPGVMLTNTRDVRLAAVTVAASGDDGIRGTGVNGFALTGASQIVQNGDGDEERGLDFTELSGVATMNGATITGSGDDNVAVVNDAATLTNLAVTGGTIGPNRWSTGEDGIRIQNTGPGATTATIRGVLFDRNRGDHVQVTTDASNTAVQNVTIENNQLRGDGNQANPTVLGGGITVNPGGAGTTVATVTGNDIERAFDSAIVANLPTAATGRLRTTIANNVIGTAGEQDSGSASGDGILVNGHGLSTLTALVRDNQVRGAASSGITVLQNDGDGAVNATVVGNTVAEPNPTGLFGLRLAFGSAAGDGGTSCLDVGGASPALRNQLVGSGVGGVNVGFSMRGGVGNTVELPGYAGGANDTAAVAAYLAGRNDTGGTAGISATQFDALQTYTGGAACPQP